MMQTPRIILWYLWLAFFPCTFQVFYAAFDGKYTYYISEYEFICLIF